MRKEKERKESLLNAKDKADRKLAEERNFEERKNYWNHKKALNKKEAEIDERSNKILQSAATFLTDAQKSFGVEFGNYVKH